ncbi:MAG: filamentous hemagglutinin family protein [Gammaproteobacteria bacterium]|jgi:filamentous hemagglutinin family protein
MNVRAFKLRPIAEFLRLSISSPFGWGALASIPGLAFAGPSGENVVGGAAVINRPNATHTLIDQSTQNAIVNWQSFSVDSEEFVIFNQPGASSSILNRVVGSQQSTILGQIQANGRVFLVNPQGILFGQGAKVDVGSLTASTLDISNNDFMSGRYVFARSSDAVDGATVENAGEIKVGDGGYVVLAGDYASNSGIITARLGSVVLAAGNQMTLDLSNDGLVSFAVDEATVSSLAGVNNSGEVLADGGQIIMTAKVANDLVATAVNNDGLLQAHRIVEQGGEIYLSAAGGNIVQSGLIDVAAESNYAGGTVELIGDRDITLTAGSEINANGAGTGNGGVVNVIADGTLAVQLDSDIYAIAGASGSKGGAVEVSGHGSLKLKGDVTVGAGGDIVIDPAILNLSAGTDSQSSGYGASDLVGTQWVEGRLNVGTNVTLRASNEINAAAGGTAIVANLGSGNLTLQIATGGLFSGTAAPSGNINLAGFEIDINGSFDALAGTNAGNVNLGKVSARNVIIKAGSAAGNVTLNTGGITTSDGDVLVEALGGAITIGTGVLPGHVTASDASAFIRMDAALGLTVNGNLLAMATSTDGGRASVDLSGQNIIVGNTVASGSSNSALVSFNATDDIVVNGSVMVDGVTNQGLVNFNAVNDIVVGGSVTVMGFNAFISLNAGNDILVTNDLAASGSNNVSVSAAAGRHLNFRHATAWTNPSFGGGVDINLMAGGNITATGDVIASNSGAGSYGGANIFASAQNIAGRDAIAYTDFGVALINFTAGNNISLRNVEAEIGSIASSGFGNAVANITAGNNVAVNILEALAGTSGGSAIVNVSGQNVAINDLFVLASTSGDAVGSINAINDITILDAAAINEGSGVASLGFNAGRDMTVNGTLSVEALSSANANIAAGNNVAVNVLEVLAGPAGGTASADVSGRNVAINDLFVFASTSGDAIGSVNAVNDITVLGATAINDGSGIALLEFNAGRDIKVNGMVDVAAQTRASYLTSAGNNNGQIGDIMVSAASGGSAFASHQFGNDGTFGRQTVTAGAGGFALAGFGDPSGMNGQTATFTKRIFVKGGDFGGIDVAVKNSIRTVGAGLLEAKSVGLRVTNNGTTTIDVRTKSPVVHIGNTGMTPNVTLDNRAFVGPSEIAFGSGGTMLKSTTLLATGSLTVRGPFQADNLAVGVTSGSVRFLDSVFITGNTPFLATQPDLQLFGILGLNGIAAPGHGPNVQILASQGISITQPFVVGGANPFTKMFSNGPFNVSGLTGSGDNFLSVFSPTNLGQNIVFNNMPFDLPPITPLGTTAFAAYSAFSGLPNTNLSTVVIGELGPGGIPLLNGSLNIASSGGTVDFGNKNLFFITRGDVTGGVDDVLTTGVVDIIGLAQAEFFPVPTVAEVSDGEPAEDDDEDDDEAVALGDDDGADDDEAVTEETDSSSMECPA